MNKLFHLKNCSTCQRIISELKLPSSITFREIKSAPISSDELEELKNKTGSYEALFNKRAVKYRQQKLNDKNLSEEDYKNLILSEYTFLKRPVLLYQNQVFAGNAPKTIEAAAKALKA